jgi:hypothetical protein
MRGAAWLAVLLAFLAIPASRARAEECCKTCGKDGIPAAEREAEIRMIMHLPPQARRFLTLINEYRISKNLRPLHISSKLTRSSMLMTYDMAKNGWGPGLPPACKANPKLPGCDSHEYWHRDSKQRQFDQRIALLHYYGGALGENLLPVAKTGDEAFQVWRNSPGHDANMLSKDYCAIGIAIGSSPEHPGPFWATDFGDVLDFESNGQAAFPLTVTVQPAARPRAD